MIREALLDARALILPVDCAGCGSADRVLCASCRDLLIPRLSWHPVAGFTVSAALRYEGPVRSVILALKEQGRTDLARALAAPLRSAIADAWVPGAALVRVPSSRGAYRSRGYEPLRVLLARAGLDRADGLSAVRDGRAQKSLGVVERSLNAVGSLRAAPRLEGRDVVLVDDILTSGATLGEAARAVGEARGRVVGGAVLAFTPRLLRIRDIPVGEDYGGAKGA